MIFLYPLHLLTSLLLHLMKGRKVDKQTLMGRGDATSRWVSPTWGPRFRHPLRLPPAKSGGGGGYSVDRGDFGLGPPLSSQPLLSLIFLHLRAGCSVVYLVVVGPRPTAYPVSCFHLQFFSTCVSAQVGWTVYCHGGLLSHPVIQI
jgi:hypothetical protein